MSCVLCGDKDTIGQAAQGISGDYYNCSVCGRFIVESDVLHTLLVVKHLIAGYLHETNLKNKNSLIIDEISINEILNSAKIPRTTMQKLEKLLLYYYRKNEYIGQEFTFASVDTTINPAVAYAKNTQEISNMITEMSNLGWVRLKGSTNAFLSFCLATKGLSYAESLTSTSVNSNKVFIAMQFRPVEGYAFLYTEVREKAIKPAVETASNNNLRAFTVDEEEHNEYITDKMIAEIKTSRFLIADLTHNNNGAYWEAGFAKGLGKEVIYTCNQDWLDAGNKLHFDIEQISGIRWRTLEELKEKLINRIRATILYSAGGHDTSLSS